MTAEQFIAYSRVLYRMTADFVHTVPDASWDFSPHPRFGSFGRQLRHVVCVRGVYTDALIAGKVNWSRRNAQYMGPLEREPLLAALDGQQHRLVAAVTAADTNAAIDWSGTPFSFATFSWEFVQHEALHHGQWSVYAALAGFATPRSWQTSWGL